MKCENKSLFFRVTILKRHEKSKKNICEENKTGPGVVSHGVLVPFLFPFLKLKI